MLWQSKKLASFPEYKKKNHAVSCLVLTWKSELSWYVFINLWFFSTSTSETTEAFKDFFHIITDPVPLPVRNTQSVLKVMEKRSQLLDSNESVSKIFNVPYISHRTHRGSGSLVTTDQKFVEEERHVAPQSSSATASIIKKMQRCQQSTADQRHAGYHVLSYGYHQQRLAQNSWHIKRECADKYSPGIETVPLTARRTVTLRRSWKNSKLENEEKITEGGTRPECLNTYIFMVMAKQCNQGWVLVKISTSRVHLYYNTLDHCFVQFALKVSSNLLTLTCGRSFRKSMIYSVKNTVSKFSIS